MTGRRTIAAAAGLLAAVAGCGGGGTLASTELEAKTVPATANIFGAGRSEPPGPGGGGAGTVPPSWRLPDGARTVTFAHITGRVTPIVAGAHGAAPFNGPEGDRRGPTSVNSWEGISGIVHRGNGMFLVGVFLGDSEPHEPAPERLDFTDGEDFAELDPELGQTFFVGDGKGRRYRVPSGATRLFLGFADAFAYVGSPGWYGNNDGSLRVTATVSG